MMENLKNQYLAIALGASVLILLTVIFLPLSADVSQRVAKTVAVSDLMVLIYFVWDKNGPVFQRRS